LRSRNGIPKKDDIVLDRKNSEKPNSDIDSMEKSPIKIYEICISINLLSRLDEMPM
jgi:hypothetical protein